jgi:hypothetical protein
LVCWFLVCLWMVCVCFVSLFYLWLRMASRAHSLMCLNERVIEGFMYNNGVKCTSFGESMNTSTYLWSWPCFALLFLSVLEDILHYSDQKGCTRSLSSQLQNCCSRCSIEPPCRDALHQSLVFKGNVLVHQEGFSICGIQWLTMHENRFNAQPTNRGATVNNCGCGELLVAPRYGHALSRFQF